MHLFDRNLNFLGGHGIVGGHVPLATGVGFAIKYRGGDQVCVCFMGEAVVNNGAFHEALNMAGALEAARASSSSRTTATAWARRSSARRRSTTSTSAAPRTTCRATSVRRAGRASRCAQAVRRSGRARAHGVDPDAARGAHLPLHGPLDVRRGERHVPHEGGARGVHEARSDHAPAHAHAGSRRAHRRRAARSSTRRSRRSCRTRGTSPSRARSRRSRRCTRTCWSTRRAMHAADHRVRVRAR